MGLLDDIYGIPEEPPLTDEGLAPPYAQPEPDPEVRAAMDREWGLPPSAPVQPEAPPPEPVAQGTAPGFASWAEMQTQEPESPGFGQFLEEKAQPKDETPLKAAFDLGAEEKALEGSPVPEAVSGPDLQAQEEARLREKASTDPVGFQAEMQQRADEEARFAAERQTEEEEAVAVKQADDAASFKTAIAKATEDSAHIRQRVEELAKREPEGFFSSDWNAGKVVGLIKAIAIGLVSPLHGLMAISGEMEADKKRQLDATNSQIALLGKQAGAISEELAAHGDLWKADQAVTLAMAKRIPSMIAAERQKYDKNGSIARSLVQAEHLAASQYMAAQQKADAAGLDRHIKMATEARAAAKELRDAAKFRRDMAPKAAGPKMSADYIKSNFGIDVPPGEYSRKDLDYLLNTKGKAQKLTGADPEAEAKAVELAQRTLELEQSQRGDVIKDSTGVVLGKPRAKSEEAKAQVRSAVVSYEQFRPKLVELMDLVKDIGEADLTAGRWPSEKESRYNLLRDELGEMYARVKQPTGILTDKPGGDIDRAKEKIPTREGWTRFSKSRNPEAVYKELTALVDDSFDTKVAIELEGFDPDKSPTKRYKGKDRQILSELSADAQLSPEEVQRNQAAVQEHERQRASEVSHAETQGLPFTEKLSEDGTLIIRTYSNGAQVVRGVPGGK